MAYYMAYGKNGVVVTKDSHKLSKMGWYMKDIQHAEYGTFEDAERAWPNVVGTPIFTQKQALLWVQQSRSDGRSQGGCGGATEPLMV